MYDYFRRTCPTHCHIFSCKMISSLDESRGYILSTQLLIGVGFVQVVGWTWQLGFNFPRLLQMAWLCRSHPHGFDNLVRKVLT